MNDLYPLSVKDLADWAARRNLPVAAARRRYAQYVVLAALSVHDIGSRIVFKGGNALRFVYGNPRGTIDLDFTAKEEVPDDDNWLRNELSGAVVSSALHRDCKLKVQSIKRMPKSLGAHFPTYQVAVGYCLLGDKRFVTFEADPRALADTVVLEISLNDLVCHDHTRKIGDEVEVLVCTLDDIVAEKLRSLLQQPIRKRNRRQDVFDIARIMTDQRALLSVGTITKCLLEKCAARNIFPTKSAFNHDIRDRASYEYDHLRGDVEGEFIAFDQAWPLVLQLVSELDIPEIPEPNA